jgi:hypothetical protein
MNVAVYERVLKGFRPTIWYIVSDISITKIWLFEYPRRW